MKNINSFAKYDEDSLKKEYLEALKDNNFKDFVGKLKLDDKLLMKYTSLLLDSCNEFNNCLNCKGIMECKNKIIGSAYLPKIVDNKLSFQYKTCRFQNKIKEEYRYLDNIYAFEVPKYLKEARMKDIYMEDKKRFDLIKYLKDFIIDYRKGKVNKGLYLSGTFGSGKSYLVAAMFNELAKDGYKSAMVFWPNFLRELKTFIDFNNKFELIKKSPLLLIDDIGAENVTDWTRDEVLCPLLQYRMDEGLPTFFTSNLTLKELEEHLSITKNGSNLVKAKRIIERINQLTDQQELITKNLRK